MANLPIAKLDTNTTRRVVKRLDGLLLLSIAILVFAGLISVSSVSQVMKDPVIRKQIIWAVLGLVPMVFMASVEPQFWGRWWKVIYGVNILLLGIVDFWGHEAKGAQRWILLPGGFQLQPSEFAKLMIVITFAQILANKGDDLKTTKGLLISLAHIAIPMLLIFKQPDLGTSLVIFAIWLGMVLVAEAKTKHIAIVLLTSLLLFGIAWQTNIIRPYQKMRLLAFVNPVKYADEGGYQLRQACIAVGSGQAFGKGYEQGMQKKGRFIPEQHTDFIFTVIGEEGGFAGSLLMLGAFAFFMWRVWIVIASASILYYRYLAAGIFTVFLFHITVNLFMALGLAPVVGVPLPFISYGGSSMMVSMAMAGLILGIRSREEELVF